MSCVKGHGLQATVVRLAESLAFHSHVHSLQTDCALHIGLLDKQADSSYCSENGYQSLLVIQTMITVITKIRSMNRIGEMSVAVKKTMIAVSLHNHEQNAGVKLSP